MEVQALRWERLRETYLGPLGAYARLSEAEVDASVTRLYDRSLEHQQETTSRLVEEHCGPEAKEQLRFGPLPSAKPETGAPQQNLQASIDG